MNPKILDQVKRFLEVYRFLSAEGKVEFERRILAEIRQFDEKTKALYLLLLGSAKAGEGLEETVKRLQKTSPAATEG